MTRFAGKVAIVTGSGTGIGFAIALKLGKEGARVMIVDHDKKLAQDASVKLKSYGIESLIQVGDVGDYKTAKDAGETAVKEWGQIDILVNNAGIAGGVGSIWELPVEEMDKVYRTNLRGVYLFCNQIIPHMLSRDYGRIVNVASIAGKEGNPRMVPYSASKAAVISMTQTAAVDLAEFNINVNAICPGILWTPMWQRIAARYEKVNERDRGMSEREVFDRYVAERIPLGREQTPEDIGNAAAFLASDLASNITGQALNVSGGSHMN